MDTVVAQDSGYDLSLRERLLRSRVRPIEAFIAMQRLLRDPEDTGQVFKIITALSGNSLQKSIRRLRALDSANELRQNRPNIRDVLNDRTYLASLPEGSLGRAYLAFVESESLSADGLVASSEEADRTKLTPEERWFADRLRDFHDLQHVVTGYGRDTLGELGLLAFMTSQVPNRGIDFIIFMGRRKFTQEMPDLPIKAMVQEGHATARAATWLPGLYWEQLMGEDLESLRKRLNVQPPLVYQQCLAASESCCQA